MTAERQIVEIRSGQGYNAFDLFLHTLMQRRIELGISGEVLDDIAGLPTRYTQKLLQGHKLFGRNSFDAMLGSLGMKLTISEDRDALEKVQDRLERTPLDKSQMRMQANARMVIPRWLFSTRKASKAGKARWRNVPAKKRRRIARKAAKARWSKPRIVEITNTADQAKTCQPLGDAPNRTAKSLEPQAHLASAPRRKPPLKQNV